MSPIGFRTTIAVVIGLILSATMPLTFAADYVIDTAHSFIQFRTQHLGYSWLYGRFNTFQGTFRYGSGEHQIQLKIDTASIDTNHAERDKHLRSSDFLEVDKYPLATFQSTQYTGTDAAGRLEGMLTLHGVTKPITLEISRIGEGDDPWGGVRAGFIATTQFQRRDFGIDYFLGPASEIIEFELSIEGIRQ